MFPTIPFRGRQCPSYPAGGKSGKSKTPTLSEAYPVATFFKGKMLGRAPGDPEGFGSYATADTHYALAPIIEELCRIGLEVMGLMTVISGLL